MSMQWNMSNADQHSDKPVLEQLWYTWSAVGLGPLSAGFRIRAASRGLSDVSSPRVQALDRYLRYVLPAGTDPFAITPDMAPICLSLIQTGQGERILVNKTYIGKDGVGRPGAFFVHLLSNLPPDFSAAQAISLWRSPFLRSSDIDPSSGIQLSGVQLDSIPFDDLKQWHPREIDLMHPKGVNSSWVYDCFPLVIRAYLMWRRRWEQWKQQPPAPQRQSVSQPEPPRLYIAAPSDMIAVFISGITRCLPPQLLTDLTFSTYEYDVRSKGQVLLAGTAWAPSPDGKTNTNQDLPASCYQEGVAINCYTYDETKTRLENETIAISFATYATQCLVAENFLELDWLFSEKTAQNLNLDVSRFLQTYDSYIVKAQNPTQKDVELYLDNADADMLSRMHVQDLILTLAIHDPRWLNDFLKPRLTFMSKQSEANLKLAGALAQLAKATSQKASFAVNSDDVAAFDAILSIMSWIANSKSEAWHMQPRILAAQPDIQLFLTNHPDSHFQLLHMWNQLSPPLSIDEVRPFLTMRERNFEAFYSYDLHAEWRYIATEALVTSAIAQGVVPILGQKYQRPVEALMQYISQNSWPKALTLFEQLAERNYPDKLRLLSILLDSSTSLTKEETEALLKKAYLKSDEYEIFLIQYGPQYLLLSQKGAIVLKLFKTFAKNVPTRKMLVLDSWLNSASLATWFAAPFTGPSNLDEVLQAASLAPRESNSFIERYGKYYLERYSQQFPTYLPSSLISGYLKHYLDSFRPKSLWQSSSPAREFLFFLGDSPLLQSLSERERLKVQKWYDFCKFLQHAYTSMTDVKKFGNTLRELGLDRDPELIERLARAFASCIESETELASVTYMMSTLITEAELIQMLYAMAEYVRDGMVDSSPRERQYAKALMQPYIQFALCFESVYDFSHEMMKTPISAEGMQPGMEEKLFLQTLLRILLQHAHQDTIERIDEMANESYLKYWQKWLVYKPLRNSTSTRELLGSSPEYMQPPRSIQSGGRSRYNLNTFLAHPSTKRKVVEALGDILIKQYSVRNLQFVERLAEAFAKCVESETELTAVTLMLRLRKSITKPELLQMLYTMAETIRDTIAKPETKRIAELRLEPYIRFILCFESACDDLLPDEYTLFVRSILNLLLMSTDEGALQELNDRTRNWPDKISQKWRTYMSQDSRFSKIQRNNARNGQRRSSSPTPESSSRDFFTSATSQPTKKPRNNR